MDVMLRGHGRHWGAWRNNVLKVTIAFSIVLAQAAFALAPAAAASDTDKAAMAQAKANCKAQVKEQARFNEMSWYARHKALKDCVKNALAKH